MSPGSPLAERPPVDAMELADRVERSRTTVVALAAASPAMVDPRLPLLRVMQELFTGADDFPMVIRRNDGSVYSEEQMSAWLARAAANRGQGLGLGEDLVSFGCVYTMIRIGDALTQLGLISPADPLLQFARHLRNACAHGNRWHFQGQEPRHPARWRQLSVDASWHGGKAMFGTLGPGDYFDFLDDLAGHLRVLSP